jgi:hypothetical protein
MVSIAVSLWLLPMNVFAVQGAVGGVTIDFHGHLEDKTVVRDTNGFQYGFMDELQVAQWMQEAQLDFDIRPASEAKLLGVSFEKAFFRYRAHYDAIWDVSDHWQPVRDQGEPGRFDIGVDDVKWENDLREGFLDFSMEPDVNETKMNLRLGRQIVQWGETDGFNLVNVVNPNDTRWNMFFSNPEDLLLPLYMLRLDLKTAGAGPFSNFNGQFLMIPDIRPNLFAPLQEGYNAPYAFAFQEFGKSYNFYGNGLGMLMPLPMHENVPSNSFENIQYGGKLGTEISGWQLSLYFLEHFQQLPALNVDTPFINLLTTGAFAATDHWTLDHPRQQMYGYSFNKYVATGNFVFRGEGSLTRKMSMVDLATIPMGGPGYSMHEVYQCLFGFDRSFSNMPIGTQSALTVSVQGYFRHIGNDWHTDNNPFIQRLTAQDLQRYSLMLLTDYKHGTIKPLIFVAYEPTTGEWMSNASVEYCPDGHWYTSLSQISFWGNKDERHDLNDFYIFINSGSEVALKLGYRW